MALTSTSDRIHWPGYYDVVILPPPAVCDYAIELSRRLRRAGGQWTLGRRAFLPHISLYHIPVRDEDLEPFLRELQDVVDSARWGALETTGLDMPVLTVCKPEWLKSLQRRVVQRTLRYFNWKYGAEKRWSLHRFSGRRLAFARQYLGDYGTPMMGMNFRPHITLNSFKGAEPARFEFQDRRLQFPVNRLHVYELGVSHSCHRLVREIKGGQTPLNMVS